MTAKVNLLEAAGRGAVCEYLEIGRINLLPTLMRSILKEAIHKLLSSVKFILSV